MSDHIEAMARTIYKDYEGCDDAYVDKVWRIGTQPQPELGEWPHTEHETWHAFHQTVVEFTGAAVKAWAAGVGALIAHEPCGGTEYIQHPQPLIKTGQRCPGPHTVIDRGDGSKLYADVQAKTPKWVTNPDDPTRAWIDFDLRIPLPSEWRIE